VDLQADLVRADAEGQLGSYGIHVQGSAGGRLSTVAKTFG
jgi:hypothetical protein